MTSVKNEFGQLSEQEQEIIAERRLICSQCPFMSNNAKTSKEYFEAFGKHYETSISEDHCSQCGCFIKLKTSSLSSDCGAKGYKDQNGNDLEVRWEKITK